MTYTQNITLDLNSNSAYPIVSAKQNDVDSRVLHINITNNGAEYLVNHNNSVALRVRKPDMHMAFIDATINYDGTVDVTLSQQCLAVPGRAYADLVEFNATGQMLSTVSFIINISASPDVMNGEAISSDDFLYLKSFIDQGLQVIGESQEWANGYNGDVPLEPSESINIPGSNNNAKYFSERANAWAEGKIGDAAVPSSDQTYNNNAKYYSELSSLNGEAWSVGTRNGTAIPSSDPAYNKYAKYQAQKASENGEAWAIGTRNNQAIPSSDPAYNKYAKYYAQKASENGEAWSIGTRNGAAIPSSDLAYKNNSKYYTSRSEAWARGAIGSAALPSTDEVYHNNSKYYSELASENGEAWSIGTRNGAAIPSSDPAYKQNAKYYSDRIGNMGVAAYLVGTDVDPTAQMIVGSDDNLTLALGIPKSNAVYVTFNIDTSTGNLYMFRPDEQTYTDNLIWTINDNGELEVSFNDGN